MDTHSCACNRLYVQSLHLTTRMMRMSASVNSPNPHKQPHSLTWAELEFFWPLRHAHVIVSLGRKGERGEGGREKEERDGGRERRGRERSSQERKQTATKYNKSSFYEYMFIIFAFLLLDGAPMTSIQRARPVWKHKGNESY